MLRARKISVPDLAKAFSFLLNRTVTDETGLKGDYDVDLRFAADEATANIGGSPTNQRAGDQVGPSIFTAVQDKLGLRLDSAKGPVEIIVVNHIERPSAN